MISWNDEASWNITNADVEEIDFSDLCKQPLLLDHYIDTERTSYDEFKATCDVLSGTIDIPTNTNELKWIHDTSREVLLALPGAQDTVCQISPNSSMVHAGQRMRSIGEWFNPYTNEMLSVENGGDKDISNMVPIDEGEDCAYIWGHTLETISCDERFACGVCKLPPALIIKMKGLCNVNVAEEMINMIILEVI